MRNLVYLELSSTKVVAGEMEAVELSEDQLYS